MIRDTSDPVVVEVFSPMRYAVLFEDNEERADQRTRYMQDHLVFLGDNASQITSAGPLFSESEGRPAGGLWLVDAPDEAAVQALIHKDPLWPTGLRKSVRILNWRRVFADGEILVQVAGGNR